MAYVLCWVYSWEVQQMLKELKYHLFTVGWIAFILGGAALVVNYPWLIVAGFGLMFYLTVYACIREVNGD